MMSLKKHKKKLCNSHRQLYMSKIKEEKYELLNFYSKPAPYRGCYVYFLS